MFVFYVANFRFVLVQDPLASARPQRRQSKVKTNSEKFVYLPWFKKKKVVSFRVKFHHAGREIIMRNKQRRNNYYFILYQGLNQLTCNSSDQMSCSFVKSWFKALLSRVMRRFYHNFQVVIEENPTFIRKRG